MIKRSSDSELTEEELNALIYDAMTIIDTGEGGRLRVIINGDEIDIDEVEDTED